MRHFRATNAPFKQRAFFKPEELEIMCIDELRKQGLLPANPEPIRIEYFLEKRFGLTPDYTRSLGTGVLGATKFGDAVPLEMWVDRILADDTALHARRRVNTTLAHECGHCLLHGYLFAVSGKKERELTRVVDLASGLDVSGGQMLCRDPHESTSGYDGRWWEWQADAMIGPLLMPSPLVRKVISTEVSLLMMPTPARPRSLSAGELAVVVEKMVASFDVNPAAARLRLEKLNFKLAAT